VRRVVWSESALTDYCDVVEYIAADSVDAAKNVAQRIDDTIETLAFMPTGRQGRVAGTYEKVVSGIPYIIAYALSDDPSHTEMLTILRIIHGARHWPEDQWPEQ